MGRSPTNGTSAATRTIQALRLLATIVTAAGCARAGTGGGGAVAGAPAPGSFDVAYAPTGPEQLPDAILGKAPAPRGHDVAYFSADPATRGYLAHLINSPPAT